MRAAAVPLLLAAALCCREAIAFPNAAGSCSEGNNAVQGSHLNNPTTGSLTDGGFTVSLAGTNLVEGSPFVFSVNTDAELTVSGGTFMGFLLRLGETDAETDTAFSFSSAEVQKAEVCVDVGGITHTSKSEKTMVSAILNMATASASMPLDVTVVVRNSGGNSEYYYSQFLLTANADAAPVAETFAPITTVATMVPATTAPFTSTTMAPVTSTTMAPVTSTTMAPVTSTTMAPVTSTTMAPVTSTTMAPVTSTSMAPATTAPVTSTSMAPVTSTSMAPATTAPVTATSMAPVTSTSMAPATTAPVTATTMAPVTTAPVTSTSMAPATTMAPATSVPNMPSIKPVISTSGSMSAGVNTGIFITAALAILSSMIVM